MSWLIGIFLVVQAVAFAVVVLILKRVLFSDAAGTVALLKNAEEARRAKDAESQEMFRRAQEAYREKIEQAEAEAARIHKDAAQESERARQEIVGQAHRESEAVIAAAKELKRTMLADLDARARQLAGEQAVGLVLKSLSAKALSALHRELIAESAAKIRGADAALFSGGLRQASVVCAQPLDESARALIAQALEAAVKKPVLLSEKVDPGLGAGVIVDAGGLVFDGSLAGALKDARR